MSPHDAAEEVVVAPSTEVVAAPETDLTAEIPVR